MSVVLPSTLISFLFILYLSHFLSHIFHVLEGRSEPVHSAKKGMDSFDETYSLTDRKPRVIYTDNCLEFGKACEALLESLHVYTTQIRNTWDC